MVQEIPQFGNCNREEVNERLKVDEADPSFQLLTDEEMLRHSMNVMKMEQIQMKMTRVLLIQNHRRQQKLLRHLRLLGRNRRRDRLHSTDES